jgi:hypothetical protein
VFSALAGRLSFPGPHAASESAGTWSRFAEQKSREDGLTTMQLELLVPRNWSHPSKEFLAAWYARIGYRIQRRGTIDESYPTLAPLLATACDFTIFHKPLLT